MTKFIFQIVAVLAVAFASACSRETPPQPANAAELVTLQYKVTGMHCDGCAQGIVQKLKGVQGVETAQASFEEGSATVTCSDRAASERIVQAISGMGFAVEPVR